MSKEAVRLKLKKNCHYLHDFTFDGVEGWAVHYDERTTANGDVKPAHVAVTIINGRAWREVAVTGTKSLRRAVLAAMPHARPLPEIKRIGIEDVFGSFVKVAL